MMVSHPPWAVEASDLPTSAGRPLDRGGDWGAMRFAIKSFIQLRHTPRCAPTGRGRAKRVGAVLVDERRGSATFAASRCKRAVASNRPWVNVRATDLATRGNAAARIATPSTTSKTENGVWNRNGVWSARNGRPKTVREERAGSDRCRRRRHNVKGSLPAGHPGEASVGQRSAAGPSALVGCRRGEHTAPAPDPNETDLGALLRRW